MINEVVPLSLAWRVLKTNPTVQFYRGKNISQYQTSKYQYDQVPEDGRLEIIALIMIYDLDQFSGRIKPPTPIEDSN